MNRRELKTPYYIVYEDKIRRNLSLISDVAKRADVKIIMAFKANALWRTFPIVKEYVRDSTASSLNEMRLGNEMLGGEVHTYCPAYTPDTIGEYLAGSTHITFNSLSQWETYKPFLDSYNSLPGVERVSAGLRVNPHCSVIETDIYNPALPGSRFGVDASKIGERLPEGIEGLHFHALCESSSYDLEKVLGAFEEQFGHLLSSVKWVNMGGGHLMTRQGYDVEHLIKLLKEFKARYPHIQVILEPGSAFMWQTGDLVTSVVDIVENDGVSTAIVDVSFACHMPDTLEMPYTPAIEEAVAPAEGLPHYRLGGNSCLSGDFKDGWTFPAPLTIGQQLTLKDMNHYTTVKTTMFNGIQHPSLVLEDSRGECHLMREFTYEDYKNRMD